MRDMPQLAARLVFVVLVFTGLVAASLAGCSKESSDTANLATTVPQMAPKASPSNEKPSGTMVPGITGASALVMDTENQLLAVVGTDQKSIIVLSTLTHKQLSRMVLPEEVSGIGPFRNKKLTLVSRTQNFEISPESSQVFAYKFSQPINTPLSAAQLANGQLLIGTESGELLTVATDRKTIENRISGFARVDAIAVNPRTTTSAEQIVVLDKAQSAVFQINLSAKKRTVAMRAGNGATTLITDSYGRFFVANTRDNEIMSFYGDPIIHKFRFPVSGGPYALAVDSKTKLLWVVSTETNTARSFDLSTGEPVIQSTITTVNQTNSIAIAPHTGEVFFASATNAGMHYISATEE